VCVVCSATHTFLVSMSKRVNKQAGKTSAQKEEDDDGIRLRKRGEPTLGQAKAIRRKRNASTPLTFGERVFLIILAFLLILPWMYTPSFVREIASGLEELLMSESRDFKAFDKKSGTKDGPKGRKYTSTKHGDGVAEGHDDGGALKDDHTSDAFEGHELEDGGDNTSEGVVLEL